MIKKTKATMDTERAKLKGTACHFCHLASFGLHFTGLTGSVETQLIPQKYAVDKLQRELEESRVVCEETLYKQKIELVSSSLKIPDLN